jgi:hypothetical protein
MASQLDAKFFRKAKKANRAVEITDNQAIIPAVKDTPEIRVNLPNRRLKTMDERTAVIQERLEQISLLDDEIETERKVLLELVKGFHEGGSGSEVVSQNLKIKILMEKRSKLSRPERWIEELPGLSLKDVFASKRDDRKIGAPVYQLKRRVEPITTLYVDLGKLAEEAEPPLAIIPNKALAPQVKASTSMLVPEAKTDEEIAQGVIIGRKKTILKIKKPTLQPGV